MRIDKSTYKLFPFKVIYEPEDGLEVRRAIQDAFEIQEFEKKRVEVHINDVVLVVTKNSDISKVVASYYAKLERRKQRQDRIDNSEIGHQSLLKAQELVRFPKQSEDKKEWFVQFFDNGIWKHESCKSQEEAWDCFYAKLQQMKMTIFNKSVKEIQK